MAVHHAVGISRQRNSGYRPSRVNIMAQGLSTPDPSLSPTHLSVRRGRATTTHYTHHQVSLMVSHNTTLVPSLGLRIGPACAAGLSAGMQRERVPPQIRKTKSTYKTCFTPNMHRKPTSIPQTSSIGPLVLRRPYSSAGSAITAGSAIHSWICNDGHTRKELDHILTNDRSFFKSIRVFRGAEPPAN